MLRAALAFVVFAGIALLCSAQGDAPVPRPDVKPGDSWTYRRMDYHSGKPTGRIEARVTFADDRVIQLVQKSPRAEDETDMTMTAEWNQVSSANGGIFTPHNGLMKFPLRPGDTWSSRYNVKFPRQGAYEVNHERTVRVIGWEDVDVPAGRFRALKIQSEGSFQRVDSSISGTARELVWYVPEVRRFVKWIFENWTFRGRVDWWGFELTDHKLQ